MRRTATIAVDALLPERDAALRLQGVPADAPVPPRTARMFDAASARVAELARPVAVTAAIEAQEFAAIFAGEGRNPQASPLAAIFPLGDRLALFAATLGAPLCEAIDALFLADDYAAAAMLDAAASIAAEKLVVALERDYAATLTGEGLPRESAAVLAYSPGYCGWHTSGQRRLFRYLEPEAIGITLGDGCLMAPIKSCSGVLVAGAPAIHRFRDDYAVCRECRTHSCRERIRRVLRLGTETGPTWENLHGDPEETR